MTGLLSAVFSCVRTGGGGGCLRSGNLAQQSAAAHRAAYQTGPYTSFGGQPLTPGRDTYSRVPRGPNGEWISGDPSGRTQPNICRRYPCVAGIVSAMLIVAGVSCFADISTTFSKFQGIQEGVHRQLIVIRHHFGNANTAIVIPGETTTTTTRLDCTLAAAASGGKLSTEEEAWCCKEVGIHCPTTSSTATTATTETRATTATTAGTTTAPLTTATTTPGLFDCRLGDPNFWPSSKRTWCCREEGFACENGCEAPCRHGGVKHTCANSVVQAATGRYHGRKDASTLAYTLTLETCPHCAACAFADVAFPEETITTKIAPTQPASQVPIAWAVMKHSDRPSPQANTFSAAVSSQQKACGALCDHGGKEQTCGARVRVAASIAISQTKRNVCFEAYSHVLQHCPFCSSCSLADTGCMEIYTTTGRPAAAADHGLQAGGKKPYHCEDLPTDVNKGVVGWSAGKAEWCCRHEQIGCASAQLMVNPLAGNLRKAMREPFSCLESPGRPMMEWSEGEKTWCCTNKNVFCVPTLAPPRLK